jgi:hypothetical protein
MASMWIFEGKLIIQVAALIEVYLIFYHLFLFPCVVSYKVEFRSSTSTLFGLFK